MIRRPEFYVGILLFACILAACGAPASNETAYLVTGTPDDPIVSNSSDLRLSDVVAVAAMAYYWDPERAYDKAEEFLKVRKRRMR